LALKLAVCERLGFRCCARLQCGHRGELHLRGRRESARARWIGHHMGTLTVDGLHLIERVAHVGRDIAGLWHVRICVEVVVAVDGEECALP